MVDTHGHSQAYNSDLAEKKKNAQNIELVVLITLITLTNYPHQNYPPLSLWQWAAFLYIKQVNTNLFNIYNKKL